MPTASAVHDDSPVVSWNERRARRWGAGPGSPIWHPGIIDSLRGVALHAAGQYTSPRHLARQGMAWTGVGRHRVILGAFCILPIVSQGVEGYGGMKIRAGGWKEVLSKVIPSDVFTAAVRTKVIVENDLRIGHGRIRWFQHDPTVTWNPADPDIPFAILNCPPFDPEMCGKAVHPSIREQGCAVIWVRADLPVGGMVHVVAHELRHLWQALTWGDENQEQREMDANIYALRDAPLPHDLAEAAKHYVRALQES